jgi:hypothetical protein
MATLTLGSIKVLEEYVTHSYFGRFVHWFGYRVYKIPLDAMDGEDITPPLQFVRSIALNCVHKIPSDAMDEEHITTPLQFCLEEDPQRISKHRNPQYHRKNPRDPRKNQSYVVLEE